MCGIAGFSLSSTSNINPRALSNALLCAIEDRGYMAAGFAWQEGTDLGWHKSPGLGSQLSLKSMPRDASNVILHTRLATHGSVEDNDNNHPVLSPSKDIALVHNGVIYNHQSVRKELAVVLPEVDTSVIPAVIEQRGIEAIDVLDGDAAIAWFNRNEPDVLHVARYQHSPLVLAQVEDGSFIFCSTEELMWKALIRLDLMPVWMHNAKELDYFTVKDGVITSQNILPEPKYVGSMYDYSYYRHQTAGAKGWGNNAYVYDSTDSWDDDDWEFYNGKWSAQDADDKEDVSEYYDPEEYSYALTEDVAFFTFVWDEMLEQVIYNFYRQDEERMWKDELFRLANEPSILIESYGKVIDGELIEVDSDYLF